MALFFQRPPKRKRSAEPDGDSEPTEVKLALLASQHPRADPEALLDVLLAHEGSVARAAAALRTVRPTPLPATTSRRQTSLWQFVRGSGSGSRGAAERGPEAGAALRKGSTLHLFDGAEVAALTPCSIVHGVLPPALADALLRELLDEARSFTRPTFKLFDNLVSSPHTACLFVETGEEAQSRMTDYYYNGSRLDDVRSFPPRMAEVKVLVQAAVNREVQVRIHQRYPNGQKLRHQAAGPWIANSALVNCYDGPEASVGWHSDQLTYLGPRPVIGSLSLGVGREFRVRRVVPPPPPSAHEDSEREKEGGREKEGECEKEEDQEKDRGQEPGQAQEQVQPEEHGLQPEPEKAWVGPQISIHLPHNSLLVMHAEMQEEWKHCVAPARSIDPHPVAGRCRINVTYRDYRPGMHPRLTPRCPCNIPAVLRVVQRRRVNRGRYFWMCHAGNVPDKLACTFFQWANFDDDGNPVDDR